MKYNLEAERVVLGHLLDDAENFKYMAGLEARHFYDPGYKAVYAILPQVETFEMKFPDYLKGATREQHARWWYSLPLGLQKELTLRPFPWNARCQRAAELANYPYVNHLMDLVIDRPIPYRVHQAVIDIKLCSLARLEDARKLFEQTYQVKIELKGEK